MRRHLSNFVIIAILGTACLLSACSDGGFSEPVVEEVVDSSYWQCADVVMHVSRTDFDGRTETTRSSDEGWKDGDRIYLILEDKDGNDVQAYVTYDASTASWGKIEYNGYRSYLTCTVPRKVKAYYFDGSVAVTATIITFDATTGVYACTDGIYTYPADGNLEVSISLSPLAGRIRFIGEYGTKFSIASGMKSYTSFFRASGDLIETTDGVMTSVNATGTTPYLYGVLANPDEPSLDVLNHRDRFRMVFDASTPVLQVGRSGYMTMPTVDSHRGWKQIFIPATGIAFEQESLIFVKGETVTLDINFTPVDATSGLVWSSSNTSVATVSEEGVVTTVGGGTATITAVVEDDTNLKATCDVKVYDVDTNGHAYVDLGLTSGTLWATTNIGASSPEDYGDYFAWGEVIGYKSGKTTFSKDTYKYFTYHNEWGYHLITKYCSDECYGTVDNKKELELSDDAARYNWGGSWRMPSYSQFYELYCECIWTWTTQNGINGFRVSSTKNTNSIFLPAAGRCSTALENVGSKGGYWTRELVTEAVTCNDEAHYLSFNSQEGVISYNLYEGGGYVDGYCYRWLGNSVRPVLATK